MPNYPRHIIDAGIKAMREIKPQLEAFDCDIPLVKMQIDWGSGRGQGRRSGSMVKGSMSDISLRGVKTYTAHDCSKYKDDWDGKVFRLLPEGYQQIRYYRAREFGCDEIQARAFALCL